MQANTKDLPKQVTHQLIDGHPMAEIERELVNRGFSQFEAERLIGECKLHRDKKHRMVGISLIVLGASICLISCVVTLLAGTEGFSNFTLVGLTTLGVVVVFLGLMRIF